MKKGEVINGYTILQDFTTSGGGSCKWTFAQKNSTEYFIKEFLFPTYPVEGSPGSPKTIAEKRKQCEAFEKHHQSIIDALKGKCAEGSNLVVARDFFRWGPKYYKVTDKIDVSSLQINDIARLTCDKRIIILKTVAHSLRILHQAGIVHGDLKPDNILIKQTLAGYYTTKLIDFDSSYFSGNPPTITEEVVGDMVYYSPELGLYVQGDRSVKPTDLQLSSDIFALGLIYCQYLTGSLPDFDKKKYRYPYVAILNGESLRINILSDKLKSLLDSMLSKEAAKRPNIDEVFSKLKELKDTDLPTPSPDSLSRYIKEARQSTSPSLTGDLVKTKETGKPTSSSLKGSLVNKKVGSTC